MELSENKLIKGQKNPGQNREQEENREARDGGKEMENQNSGISRRRG